MARTDAVAFVVEDYLVGLVNGQTGAGQKLAGVVTVERATPPEKGPMPAVGIAFDRFTGDIIGSGSAGPVYQRDGSYTLTVSILQPYSPTAPDTVASARVAVRQYVDDGNGNGLLPLLKSDPLLGNTVDAAWITGLEVAPYQSKSTTAGTVAMAVVTLRTRYRTR